MSIEIIEVPAISVWKNNITYYSFELIDYIIYNSFLVLSKTNPFSEHLHLLPGELDYRSLVSKKLCQSNRECVTYGLNGGYSDCRRKC